MSGYLDTRLLARYKRVVEAPHLSSEEAWVSSALPGVLFVGLGLAKHPDVAARIVADDRDRLIQEQE